MTKKLNVLVLVIAALIVLAIPAMASGAPTVTSSGGISTPVGTTFKLRNSLSVSLTSSLLGPIECSFFSLEGSLGKNSGGVIEGSSGGKFTSSGCSNHGNPVTFTSISLSNIKAVLSGVGEASFVTVVDVSGLTCTFTGTGVPFHYLEEGFVLEFTKAGTVDGSPAGCGKATFDGTFEMLIGVTPVILD